MLKKGATIPQNKHNQFTQKPVYILTENEYNNLVKRANYDQEEIRFREKLEAIERTNELINENLELKSKVSNLEEEIKELKHGEEKDKTWYCNVYDAKQGKFVSKKVPEGSMSAL